MTLLYALEKILHLLGLGSGLLLALVGLPGGGRVLLGLVDGDHIGQVLGRSLLALSIGGLHDLHLHSEHTLLDEDVAASLIDELLAGVTGLDHVTLLELHGVSTLLAELSGHDDLASLGTSLQSAADDSVSSTADGETSQQLVLEGLSLNLGGEAAVHHALSVENDVVLVEAESTNYATTTK